MQMILSVIHVILAILLIIVILLQRNGADGLGGMGGNTQPVFSTRTASSFLTKFTSIIFALFAINCLFLGRISMQQSRESTSIVDQYIEEKSTNDETLPLSEKELLLMEKNSDDVSVPTEE